MPELFDDEQYEKSGERKQKIRHTPDAHKIPSDDNQSVK